MRSTPRPLGSLAYEGRRPRSVRHSLACATAAALLAGSLAATTASAQGGLLGGLKKRATDAVEQKANQKVNQKIDQAAQKLVDKSFDSMFESSGSGSGGGGGGGGKRGGFSLFPNAPTEAVYEFDASLTYEIESMPKGKPSDDVLLMTMLANKDGKYTGIKFSPETRKKGDGDLFAIFDVKNESMVMLMQSDKEKMSMAYSWKDAKQYAANAPAPASTGKGGGPATTATASDAKPMTYTSLGKRTIAGYSADGWKGENEDGGAEVWVTRDASLPTARSFGPATSMKQMRGVMPGQYPTGLLLEVNTFDRKTGDKGRMTVKSIEAKSKTQIDMSEYPRMGASK